MSESAPSKQRSGSFWRCVALSSTLRLLIECSSSVPLGFFSFFCWLPLCCMLFSYTHTQACNSVAPLLTSVAPQIWSKNIKVRSIDLTALKKHGKVYEDGESSAASCLLPVLMQRSSTSVTGAHCVPRPQISLAAWSGRTLRPTSCTWRRRREQRRHHSSRFVHHVT